MKKLLSLGAGALALLVLTPLASGHATVSLLQPQGRAFTAASVTYILRVPNEKCGESTLQRDHDRAGRGPAVDLGQAMADWTVILERRDTGQKNSRRRGDHGDRARSPGARRPGARIKPGFYGEFQFRLRNPASPQRLCFSIDQWYTPRRRGTRSRRR